MRHAFIGLFACAVCTLPLAAGGQSDPKDAAAKAGPVVPATLPAPRLQGTVEVDYGKRIAVGHAEVFGQSTWPLNNNPAFAKLYADCGVTIMRTDLNLRLHILPKTTIADYKANVGDVRNSEKWDWTVYDRFLDAYSAVGIRHLLIMFAVPDWLAANPSPKTAETSVVQRGRATGSTPDTCRATGSTPDT